jgi:hypothetical protein
MIFDLVDIHWVGHKKDGYGNGHVWGYFTEKGKSADIVPSWLELAGKSNTCCVFWGRVGKTLHFRDTGINYEFELERRGRSKNYKQVEPHKVLSRWSDFHAEIGMYLLHKKLKNA